MKKEYESTIEEAVQTSFRLSELLGTISKLKWLGLFLWAPLVYWLARLQPFVDVDQDDKVPLALISFILFVFTHLLTYKKWHRERIRRLLVKAMGTDQPVPSAYEIDETGLAFRKMGQEVKFSWASIRDVKEFDDALEILMEPMGIAIIPKRIFQDSLELQEWLTFIRQHTSDV